MKLAADSSALAKRYVREVGSEELGVFLERASMLALCVVSLPEIVSGLNRLLREGALSVTGYRKSKRQLLEDVRDATILQITPAVVSRSIQLLENNVLRALDALHIACALEWGADLFVTSDRRQFHAAINEGLKTEYIGRKNTATDS